MAYITQVRTEPSSAPAEHVALAALCRSEEEFPPRGRVALERLFRRAVMERPQVGDDQLAVACRHGKCGHLRAGNAGEDVLQDFGIGASPAPLSGREVRPAASFGVFAMTGRARFLKQLFAGREVDASPILRRHSGNREGPQTRGSKIAHAKT